MNVPSLHIQAPGRICLLGDHQDYLGLPVIACAINRYVWLEAMPIPEPSLRISFPDLGTQRYIPLSEDFAELDAGDHLGAGIRLLHRRGIRPQQGYLITLHGNLPINAGVSSSSAVVVAWMHFLWKAFGQRELSALELGQWAYEAEVVEQQAPGGKMDQMTIAQGGLVHIDTREGGEIHSLPVPDIGLVLAESGIPKATDRTLRSLRILAQQAIGHIQAHEPSFQLARARVANLANYLPILPPSLRPVFEAAVGNHALTRQAHALLCTDRPPPPQLGKLLSQHHALLRDKLKLSPPAVERLVQAALAAGALGAKIVGSGGGGCIAAITHPREQEQVAAALLRAGAKQAYPVQVSVGSRLM